MDQRAEDSRIKDLEKEVKNLTRLVREMAAREKVLTTRLHMVAREAADSKKQLRELNTTAKKIDARVTQVQSKQQR